MMKKNKGIKKRKEEGIRGDSKVNGRKERMKQDSVRKEERKRTKVMIKSMENKDRLVRMGREEE